MRTSLLLALALFAAIHAPLSAQNPGCNGSRYIDNVFSTVTKTTVVYAPTVNALNQPINLEVDIYQPAGDTLSRRPVVVLAHGGSFILGDKSLMQKYCELLAKKGYVAASIQYRLFPFFVLGVPDSLDIFDTAMKATGDMKAAVRFFREDAATTNTYHVDAENIFIGGYSAGAVTALHTGYLDSDDQLPSFLQTILNNNGGLEGQSGTSSNKTYSSKSKAVINMSGGLYRSYWVDQGEIPLSSIHGTADATVPYTYGLAASVAFLEGSSLVHARAETEGVWNHLITVPGAGHTDLYDQTQWKPFVDSFWVTTSALLETLTCGSANVGTHDAGQVALDWTLAPNPVTGGGFNVWLPEGVAQADVQVFDVSGKPVFEAKNISSGQFIRLPALPAGVYVACLQSSDKPFVWKRLLID